jgi:branched-chain amino acid transport system ATP-binding protein
MPQSATPSLPVLETRKLGKSFAGIVAVRDLDLSIAEGTIHALIGPNGAGKTTVFNLLTKVHAPTSGAILFRGQDITGLDPADVARLGIVRSFQISAIFPAMSVLENVRVALQRPAGLATQFWRSDRALDALDARARALLAEVGLEEEAARAAGELPYGQKRALEIATTLALTPDLLLLDEPMAGLAHETIPRIAALIRKVAVGRTVIMVEHNLSVVADLCDRVSVLQRGQILAEGDYATVSADPRVREAYMGNGHD